jgi:Mu transposase, C-terminal
VATCRNSSADGAPGNLNDRLAASSAGKCQRIGCCAGDGIELEGLKYNGPELGELRRRMRLGAKVELTFDPGDLGHINVLNPLRETYIHVPAVDQGYAKGLSLWQHKVIRRYAHLQLSARTDIAALAQAKAEIRQLVEHDFNRKFNPWTQASCPLHGRLHEHTRLADARKTKPGTYFKGCRPRRFHG